MFSTVAIPRTNEDNFHMKLNSTTENLWRLMASHCQFGLSSWLRENLLLSITKFNVPIPELSAQMLIPLTPQKMLHVYVVM